MTVRTYAEKNPDQVLSLMTPNGFLRIVAKELLAAQKVRPNPGCSSADMTIPANKILEMVVIEARNNENSANMLVGYATSD